MHELSLCKSLLDQASHIAEQVRARKVSRISLKIGALAAVDIPLLQFAFEHSPKESRFSETELDIEQSPLMIHCPHCQMDAEAKINDLRCPQCGHVGHVLSGNEMMISGMDYA
ncbi:MAG: hydrogenase maturation nickel metallochaperone HypA [Gammaproteobacteria bacterium]|nr:hydrogenase maturation nickel metallochaperone HypA [Gammaproteobacteria bacterium]